MMSLLAKSAVTVLAGAGVTVTWRQVIINLNFWNVMLLIICVIVFSIGLIQVYKEYVILKDRAVKRFNSYWEQNDNQR